MISVLNSTLIDFGKKGLKPDGSPKRGPRIDVSMSLTVLMFVSMSLFLFSSVSVLETPSQRVGVNSTKRRA